MIKMDAESAEEYVRSAKDLIGAAGRLSRILLKGLESPPERITSASNAQLGFILLSDMIISPVGLDLLISMGSLAMSEEEAKNIVGLMGLIDLCVMSQLD